MTTVITSVDVLRKVRYVELDRATTEDMATEVHLVIIGMQVVENFELWFLFPQTVCNSMEIYDSNTRLFTWFILKTNWSHSGS